MEGDDKKHIDESYKAQVEKEKDEKSTEENFTPPEATFTFFITTIGMQSAIALGDMPNPVSNLTEKNLSQAKFLIDTLEMLREKTKNNLSPEEASHLEDMLYELRMRFVQKSNNSA